MFDDFDIKNSAQFWFAPADLLTSPLFPTNFQRSGTCAFVNVFFDIHDHIWYLQRLATYGNYRIPSVHILCRLSKAHKAAERRSWVAAVGLSRMASPQQRALLFGSVATGLWP